MSDFPLRLKPEDRVDDGDDASGSPELWIAPAEDVLSALTESQILEISGKLGVAKQAILKSFDQTLSPSARRPLRIAFSHLDEAIRLTLAVLGSTRRV